MRIARVCCLMLFVTFLAVAVMGCGSSRSASSDEPSDTHAAHSDDGADAEVMAALAELPEEDRLAAEAQKYCAVMMESRLGSMGAPFKVMVEVVMTPATYAVVGWLKRREQEDFYDSDTNFTPFSLKD